MASVGPTLSRKFVHIMSGWYIWALSGNFTRIFIQTEFKRGRNTLEPFLFYFFTWAIDGFGASAGMIL